MRFLIALCMFSLVEGLSHNRPRGGWLGGGLGNLQEGRGREWGGGWGDSPHALGLAQAACPGQMAALPGTVLPVRLPRALALLLVLLLVVVELLDAVLVADLQQVGIGLRGRGGRVRRATCLQRTPAPSSSRGSSRCRHLHSGRR